MALTAAEQSDLKRFCGYPPLDATAGSVIDAVIAALTPEMETVVRSVYLANIRLLESALVGAGIGDTDSLDTKKAAVWERNPNELYERVALFTAWRYRLCYDLGVAPGPGITTILTGVNTTSDDTFVPAVMVV